MRAPQTAISLKGLQLTVTLGWTTPERKRKQTVCLDVYAAFPTPPTACETDQLEDTVCYDRLVRSLHQQLEGRAFKLIEHLGKTVHSILAALLPATSRLQVDITKYPDIPGLTGGVCFHYHTGV